MVRNCFLRGTWLVGACLITCFSLPAEKPPLFIQAENSAVLLSWPSWAGNSLLEQTTGFPPATSWSALSPALYQSNASHFSYRHSNLQGAHLFRLRRTGPPVPGLTGYWQFDEGSGSVAGDLTGLGGWLGSTNTSWASGRFGGSMQFNGLDPAAGGSLAWLSNANHHLLPPTGLPFSISLWFSPDSSLPGPQRILGNDANGINGWHLTLDSPASGTNYLVLTGISNGTNFSLTGRTLLLPGQWYRLTITSSSNLTSLYLDNHLLAQGIASLPNHSGPLYLGAVPATSESFAGRLDELRTYTNALTAEQLSLAGLWRFDENNGDVAADTSIQGGLASVPASNSWKPGKSGSGIDTALGPVIISNEDFRILPPSGGAFTLSLWLRPRLLLTGRTGLFYCGDDLSRGWQMTVDVDASGQKHLEVTSTNLGGTLRLRTPITLPIETWTRLDLTYNGGIATLYANGTKLLTESGAIRPADASLLLGAVPGTHSFDGIIDEFKVYRHELAEAQLGPVARPLWEMALRNSSTNIVLPASGPPGKTLTYSILSTPGPSRGAILWSPNSSTITYQAGAQKGPDTFVYTVSDGEFTSPPATGVVSVVQPHWLSPSGGQTSPRDGASPDRAWAAGSAAALDAIWRTNNYYDCFFYAPGEYHTTGVRFGQRSSANPGCKHIGAGTQDPVTTIKLVDTWSTWQEGTIFGSSHPRCDAFEVHNLLLDCNADNNPKYSVGEPVWLRVPLAATGVVDHVVLRWNSAFIAANGLRQFGRAAQFDVCARVPAASGYLTNCVSASSTGMTDVVHLGSPADELLIQLRRRADSVDFYALSEIDVSGPPVSLPRASLPDDSISQLDSQHSPLMLADQNPGTSWASATNPGTEVRISLPFSPGTAITHVQFQWNCQTLPDLRRLGPAANYLIFARDPLTGLYSGIPYITSGRSAAGLETATFVHAQVTNSIVTDQLLIVLTSPEPGVDSYSLREVSCKNFSASVPLRVPSAMNTLSHSRSSPFIHAFDLNTQTVWASATQGAVTAISLTGSHLKYTRLKILGFGTKALRECFPLILVAPQSGPGVDPVRNVLVEDCLFTQPATNNTDGLSAVVLVAPDSQSLQNAVVRRCAVVGVRSHFSYSHAFAAPVVEHCFVNDCEAALYYEPEPNGSSGVNGFGTVLVRSNLFQNVLRGIGIDFHAGGGFDSLICIGNEMVLSETSSWGYAVGGCDTCRPGPSGTITNATLLYNTIRYPDWSPRPAAPHTGFLYNNIQHAVFANNLVALGTPNPIRVRQFPSGTIPATVTPEDCDNPGLVTPGPSTVPPSLDPLLPGYRRAWYNNRDLYGLLLPVRFLSHGVDRPASQQQWPE